MDSGKKASPSRQKLIVFVRRQYKKVIMAMCMAKKEEYKCCGKTFKSKEELEAHKKKAHKK